VRDAQWHVWATAGERLPLRGESPEPLRRAERDALLGAVFGVVSAQLAHLLPGTDAHGAHPDRLRHLVEHVIDRFEGPR